PPGDRPLVRRRRPPRRPRPRAREAARGRHGPLRDRHRYASGRPAAPARRRARRLQARPRRPGRDQPAARGEPREARPRDRRRLPARHLGGARSRPDRPPDPAARRADARQRSDRDAARALPVAARVRRARPPLPSRGAPVPPRPGGGVMLGRLPALLASGALLLPSFGGLFHLPAAVERWLYNPRERIGQANGRIEAGKPAEALPPLETALRLAPDDPRVQFDAGTARL